jgi:hypothetical protein
MDEVLQEALARSPFEETKKLKAPKRRLAPSPSLPVV